MSLMGVSPMQGIGKTFILEPATGETPVGRMGETSSPRRQRMADINGISGLHAAMWNGVAKPAADPVAEPNAAAFVDLMKNGLDKVELDQTKQAVAIEDLVTGKTQDVLPVVQAVADADLSFKLLLGVRNKMVDAYKQAITMQV